MKELKADRPHPRDYLHTLTDYRHTDKHLRLVIIPVALCCTRQSRAPSAMRVETDEQTDGQMDGQTDGRYQVHYVPASRSINIGLTLGLVITFDQMYNTTLFLFPREKCRLVITCHFHMSITHG